MLLPAMGINQNFPRAVAYTPIGHKGLAIPSLFTEQLSTAILSLLKYGKQRDNLMGHLI